MNFIKRLKEENKLEELVNYFNTNFSDLNWQFKFKDFTKHNFIQFTVVNKKGKEIAYFNVVNFDCTEPKNLDPKCKYTHLYGQIRSVYLKFMKNNFPEYKDEFIINAQQEAKNKMIEIISL